MPCDDNKQNEWMNEWMGKKFIISSKYERGVILVVVWKYKK